jgi:hypothetical protein
MTEAEAWREIGQAFETPPKKRNARQRKLTGFGLCYALYYCGGGYGGPVDWPLPCETSRLALDLFDPDQVTAYFWPLHARASDLERAVAAYLLAEMAE